LELSSTSSLLESGVDSLTAAPTALDCTRADVSFPQLPSLTAVVVVVATHCRALPGAAPSAAFFAQLSRYTDERNLARDLLNQHSSWLTTFRSQMNLNGTRGAHCRVERECESGR
jgi:hypothetical protein